MSFSIVLALAALGLPGLAVLVLWRPSLRPLAVAVAGPLRGGRRARKSAALWQRWWGARGGRPSAPPPETEPEPEPQPAGVPVMGYATFSDRFGAGSDDELARQGDVIARACERRGLVLVEMVGDPHHAGGPVGPRLSGARPGLRYALGQIAAGEAQGLVVPGLRRLTRSVAELGPIVEWCLSRQARLVAVAQGFDTAAPESRVAARLIIEVSRWERERLSESLGEGQSPTPRWTTPAVLDDDPDLYSRSGGERS
jgi:Resolvase, N terminal domain